jgi:hypothetical protein
VPRNSGAEWPSAGHIGNVGRNVLRGPGQSNLDFSVGERFPLAKSKVLEFHADFFTVRSAFHPSLARGGAEVVGASGLQARSHSAKISSWLYPANPAEAHAQLLCEKSPLLEGDEVAGL